MIIDDSLKKETEKKKKHKPNYKIPNSVLKLINHVSMIEEDCIVTRNGFTDYLLLENYSIRKEPTEIQRQGIQSYVDFFRSTTSDIKLII